MKTDNVLVSREKWEKMLTALSRSWDSIDSYNRINAMSDFIESERDVEAVAKELWNQMWDYHQPEDKKWENIGKLVRTGKRESAQAAINALKYRKEGE